MSLATAYWCVLVAAVLPYVWIGLAKTGARGYNNRNPRAWLARQEGNYRVQRANAAHLNAFEAFPAFAAAVLMAQFAQVDAQHVAWLSMAFIAFRILHGIFYLAALQALRSLAWLGGFASVIALMLLAALNVGG